MTFKGGKCRSMKSMEMLALSLLLDEILFVVIKSSGLAEVLLLSIVTNKYVHLFNFYD